MTVDSQAAVKEVAMTDGKAQVYHSTEALGTVAGLYKTTLLTEAQQKARHTAAANISCLQKES